MSEIKLRGVLLIKFHKLSSASAANKAMKTKIQVTRPHRPLPMAHRKSPLHSTARIARSYAMSWRRRQSVDSVRVASIIGGMKTINFEIPSRFFSRESFSIHLNRRTGLMRPTQGPYNMGIEVNQRPRSKTNKLYYYQGYHDGSIKYKRKPPKGMWINHGELCCRIACVDATMQ